MGIFYYLHFPCLVLDTYSLFFFLKKKNILIISHSPSPFQNRFPTPPPWLRRRQEQQQHLLRSGSRATDASKPSMAESLVSGESCELRDLQLRGGSGSVGTWEVCFFLFFEDVGVGWFVWDILMFFWMFGWCSLL